VFTTASTSSSAAAAAHPVDVGAASGATPPGGHHTLVDLAGIAFKELMAKALGSAARDAGGSSSAICPRGENSAHQK